jgi:glycosyltransferase involved in cell wall biosynthesis
MTRLLGVQVAHGVSSESRVLASLLAERNDRYEAVLLVHQPLDVPDDTRVRLGALAAAPTVPVDTGWRPNRSRNRVSLRRANVALTYLRRMAASTEHARTLQPDLVYSSQQHYDCRTASRIARSLAVPQIVHLHYNVGPWLRRAVVERLRTTDHVVTVSDFVRRQVLAQGVHESKVTTIRNAMHPFAAADPDAVAQLRSALGLDGSFAFGMVGRLDPSKGHLDAIAALERSERDDVKLVIVGTGRIEDRIRRRAAGSPVSDRIIFTGQRRDVPELLASFDAFVHPATDDPCPLAVLEAMAAGRGVLAYADGGLPEMIDDGESGVLVPHRDVRGLAAAMARLRDDPQQTERFGAAARRRLADEFRPEDAGTAFADLVVSMA